MDGKMKDCFSQHSIAHSLTGAGIALVLAHYYPGLATVMVGVVVLVVGVVVDMMRK